MIDLNHKTPPGMVRDVAKRVRERRKEQRLTQAQLVEKAGMPLASCKRFEQKGLVSFQSLAAVAIALRCESDFDAVLSRRAYRSIDEVIAQSAARKRGAR